jgi:hypothetical protein
VWRESWERLLLWGFWGSTLTPETVPAFATDGGQGLRIEYDLTQADRQILYTAPHPSWDLTQSAALTADVYAPPENENAVQIQLGIGGRHGRYESPPQGLAGGWNRVRIELAGRWLPAAALTDVDRVEWIVSPPGQGGAGWVAIDNFRSRAR